MGTNLNDFNGLHQTTNQGAYNGIPAAEMDATHLQHMGVSH